MLIGFVVVGMGCVFVLESVLLICLCMVWFVVFDEFVSCFDIEFVFDGVVVVLLFVVVWFFVVVCDVVGELG